MNIDDLVSRYPRLYHLASSDAWESIKTHGLLSTAALAQRWEVPLTQYRELTARHRPESTVLHHKTFGRATIRDQRPMHPAMLRRALTDMPPEAWLQLLNSMVFFSPTTDRLERLHSAYQGVPALVLTLDTRSLVTAHLRDIRLSRLNSGAVRHINHHRGSTTFRTLDDFTYSTNNQVAELAVLNSVPNIQAHVLRAERRVGGQVIPLNL
ncbi:DUF7002 family protein [Kribbella sp. CA-293567]|uniref:DUF7002 family protein n=1 Tax=Kribbella sp. CA-293567 TaxID=3002436 RepID=UPI0022DE192D|nr:hypothetical protein [Kribbella sp. CA-293567]WBQ07822.1 hypothetical protein OX958_13720 [Kribbella sp. CA-293567]